MVGVLSLFVLFSVIFFSYKLSADGHGDASSAMPGDCIRLIVAKVRVIAAIVGFSLLPIKNGRRDGFCVNYEYERLALIERFLEFNV